MKLLKKITDKDICGTDAISHANPRIAVRAIVLDDAGYMALLHMGKYNLYTIPGGGVEAGEDLEMALKREILEEAGCDIVIINELGYIDESRAEHSFTQISNYYLAKVIGPKGIPHMTDAEIAEQTQVQWHLPEKALDIITNENAGTYQQKYIQFRDKVVIGEAINYLRTEYENNLQ